MGSARRKSGGFLSQPAQRVTQQTPTSVSSSFAELPDDREYLANEPLTIHSIQLSSPPVTSPLSVFSHSDSLEKESRTNEDSEINENNLHSSDNNDPGETSEFTLDDKPVTEERDETPFTSRSRRNLEEDLPALNAALDDFTNLNISFNFDISSDDEDSFKRSRISRDRSRAFGPILPIPSLRNDIDTTKITPNQSTPIYDQDDTTQLSASSQSARASPLDDLAHSIPPLNLMEDEEEDLPDNKSLRTSRPRSRDLELLLPIPSLRDDLPYTKNDLSPAGDQNCSDSPEDGQRSTGAGLPIEILENVIKMDEEVLVRHTRASRDRKNLGPLLPAPSLRDYPSDEKPPSSGPNPGILEQSIQDQYGKEKFAKESPVGEQVPLPQLLQLDISSPFQDDTPARRRRRQSYASLTPAILKKDKESGSEPAIEESNTCTAETLGVAAKEFSQHIDSIPLVKYKDRHILTVVPEEPQNTSVIEALQGQLAQALIENRQQAEKLARYNQTYEERVTPFRTLFEDWREEKQSRRAAEAQNALVQEVQEKVTNALKISFQKCQELETQLQASQQRVAELERQAQNGQHYQTRQSTTRKR